MLRFYSIQNAPLCQISELEAQENFGSVVWVDLINPTVVEEKNVEMLLGLGIPTRDEMHEIELSSRLYQENDALYMTAVVLAQADTDRPEAHAISFALSKQCLVTLRYAEPSPFKYFVTKYSQNYVAQAGGHTLLVNLADAIVDRIADLLEMVGHRVDDMTYTVFQPTHKGTVQRASKPDFNATLSQIGLNGDLISKIRESMLTLNRLLSFASHSLFFSIGGDEYNKIQIIQKDIAALNEHASFLSSKINFLLDATLGMINMEQNNIIKIFSVASVVFLPPTLVASLYGMNFEHMPELKWVYGYPLALVAMLLSAYLPYKFFRQKGWL